MPAVAELGAVRETEPLEHAPKEEERLKEVVQVFMKSLDKPEKLSVDDAADVAALKLQVTVM